MFLWKSPFSFVFSGASDWTDFWLFIRRMSETVLSEKRFQVFIIEK